MSLPSFRKFISATNIKANDLKPGDHVENINDECKHFKSKGVVSDIRKIEEPNGKDAGNVVVYKCTNCSDDFNKDEVNGKWGTGDTLQKTEIQLRRINDKL